MNCLHKSTRCVRMCRTVSKSQKMASQPTPIICPNPLNCLHRTQLPPARPAVGDQAGDHGRSNGRSREITGDHGRSNGRSREVTGDQAGGHGRSSGRSREIKREVTGGHGRSREVTGDHGRSRKVSAAGAWELNYN